MALKNECMCMCVYEHVCVCAVGCGERGRGRCKASYRISGFDNQDSMMMPEIHKEGGGAGVVEIVTSVQ